MVWLILADKAETSFANVVNVSSVQFYEPVPC